MIRKTWLLGLCLLSLAGCGDESAPARPSQTIPPVAAPSASGTEKVGEMGEATVPEALVRAPESDGGVLLIGVAEVRQKLEGGEPLLLIDARGRGEFEQEHIPGAINIPLPKLAAASQLPGIARDYEIVVYCIAETCPVSRDAVRVLSSLGYTNVRDMRAGLLGWKEAGFETIKGRG